MTLVLFAVAAAGASCAPTTERVDQARAERDGKSVRAARKPLSRPAGTAHVSTWDTELHAVATVLARLDPGHGILDIGGTGPGSLRVISRAAARAEDAEQIAAGDTCSTKDARIVCVDQAIAAIVGARSSRLHPVLLFLIAHELDHVRHGDQRQFAMPAMRIAAHATPDQIIADVRPVVCAERRTDEARADEFARDVLGRAIAAGEFSQGGTDVGLAAAWVLGAMFESAARASQGGDRDTDALLDSTNPATAEQIAELSKRVLCLIRPGQRKDVVWQGFPGGYDTEGVRLTRTTDLLEDELLHGRYGLAEHAGNLRDLLRSMVDIRRVMMRQNADLVTGVAAQVCAQMRSVADPWAGNCSAPPRRAEAARSPASTCPVLEAPAAGPPRIARTSPGAAPTITVQGNELHVTQPVTAVALRASGETIVAIGDQGQIAAWRTPRPPMMVGDAGCSVGGIAEDGAALVAVCSRGEAIVRLEAGQRTTTRLAALRVGGEPDTPDHVRVSWVGAVAGHLLAAVDQIGSGEGRLVDVAPDGLRSTVAWTAAGCDARMFSARVAAVDGALWATPAHPAIAPQLLQLSAGFERVVSRLQPDDARVEAAIHGQPRGDVPVMTCHASATRHVPLCVAMDGAFVDARKPMARVLASVAPAMSWAPGSATVRSCGTVRADYLMVVEHSGHARLFELPARTAQARQVWQIAADVDHADLVCGDATAALFVQTGDSSTVVAFGGGR